MGRRRFGRHVVETSNEDKVLFPDCGLTKGELMDHYDAVADVLLPHVREHPMTLQRFPDGIEADGFYQKQASDHFPDWIPTTRVSKEGGHQDLVVCDKRATLVYLANQAAITLHPWLSRRDRSDHPDRLVFDLDPPGDGDDFGAVRDAARLVRELLEELGLAPFAKLTGSKGVHVVAPLDRKTPFDDVRSFARDAAALLAARHPKTLTTEQRKAKRAGRLYLDVARNAYAQTAVAAYAVRARPGAPVAAPIDWDELGDRRLDARRWTVRNVRRRLGQRDDPWQGFARRARSLAKPRRRLTALREDEGGAG